MPEVAERKVYRLDLSEEDLCVLGKLLALGVGCYRAATGNGTNCDRADVVAVTHLMEHGDVAVIRVGSKVGELCKDLPVNPHV